MKEVAVSFLKEGSYKEHIKKINNSEADYIHFDVMDGKFVENKNLSLKELEEYIKISQKKIDVHLMVTSPKKYIDLLSLYNVSYITIHKEIDNYKDMLALIKSYGIKAGLAINPETEISDIINDLKDISYVLIMGVHPGKSGQKFISKTEDKIDELKALINKENLNVKIGIDGGVCDETIEKLKNADIIVSASYILDNFDNIEKIKKLLN